MTCSGYQVFRFVLLTVMIFLTTSWAIADPLQDGVAAYSGQQYQQAHQLWLPLAEQGNAKAQLYIGVLYRYGLGVEEDPAKSAQWYEKAASSGLADAQYETGLMYELGKGVEQDYWVAESWYGKAIAQGFCPGELSATGGLIP